MLQKEPSLLNLNIASEYPAGTHVPTISFFGDELQAENADKTISRQRTAEIILILFISSSSAVLIEVGINQVDSLEIFIKINKRADNN